MRALAFAGLVVAALGFALWFLVVRDGDSAIAADSAPAPRSQAEPAPSTTPVGEMQPRTAVNLRTEIEKTRPAPRVESPGPGPSLAPEAPGSGSDPKPATPEQTFRWKLWQAIRKTEPAVIECFDAAKKSGAVVDGISSYGIVLARKGDKIVYEGSTFEYGPYSGSVQDCVRESAKGISVEYLPDGMDRIVAFRKITVENGEITNYQSPTYEVQPQ